MFSFLLDDLFEKKVQFELETKDEGVFAIRRRERINNRSDYHLAKNFMLHSVT
jgi:hypothetical protein